MFYTLEYVYDNKLETVYVKTGVIKFHYTMTTNAKCYNDKY